MPLKICLSVFRSLYMSLRLCISNSSCFYLSLPLFLSIALSLCLSAHLCLSGLIRLALDFIKPLIRSIRLSGPLIIRSSLIIWANRFSAKPTPKTRLPASLFTPETRSFPFFSPKSLSPSFSQYLWISLSFGGFHSEQYNYPKYTSVQWARIWIEGVPAHQCCPDRTCSLRNSVKKQDEQSET